MGIRIDVHHHFDAEPSVLVRLLESIVRTVTSTAQKVNVVMTKVSELPTILGSIKDQVDKSRAEITARIADLEAAINNAGDVPPEVEAALSALKASVQTVDDIVPDAPAAQPPADETSTA